MFCTKVTSCKPASVSFITGTTDAMKHVTTAEARKQMAELLNRAAYGKERFVVTRHGKELVAIVPLEEMTLLDRLRTLLSRKDFEAALAEVEESRTRPWSDVRRELGE
jgi:prevent-host-death family protein